MADKGTDEARVFAVETRFQTLARRPGGVSRQDAVRKAQVKLQAIAPDFDDWLENELKALGETMRRIQDSGGDAASLEAASESGYQLQGIGATMNCELVSYIAGSLCGVLDEIAAGAACNVDAIRCHVDALMLAARKDYRHMRPDQVPQLIAGLRRVFEQVAAGSAAARPALG